MRLSSTKKQHVTDRPHCSPSASSVRKVRDYSWRCTDHSEPRTIRQRGPLVKYRPTSTTTQPLQVEILKRLTTTESAGHRHLGERSFVVTRRGTWLAEIVTFNDNLRPGADP